MAFSDVPASNQFHREITWVTDIGIATGWPNGTFRPYQSVKRDAMAAFLYRLARANYEAPAVSPFTPSSAVGGHSGGSERALLLVSAIRWFRNG